MKSQILFSALIMFLLDFIYLYTTSTYFNKQIFNVQNKPLQLNVFGAAVAYLFMLFGLYYFILRENKNMYHAFLLGLVIYMTFDGTNKAIFKNWTWTTLLIDGIWGGILFALTTLIVNYIS